MRISKNSKTAEVKASSKENKCSYEYWQREVMDERLAGMDSDDKYEEYLKWKRTACENVDACGDVKASTVNADAIKYIKAAIDVLGKSGNKDSVTKDSIANLATVMFDLKGSEK